jgi:hypothetical protein
MLKGPIKNFKQEDYSKKTVFEILESIILIKVEESAHSTKYKFERAK